jgi:hypothetical protein
MLPVVTRGARNVQDIMTRETASHKTWQRKECNISQVYRDSINLTPEEPYYMSNWLVLGTQAPIPLPQPQLYCPYL